MTRFIIIIFLSIFCSDALIYIFKKQHFTEDTPANELESVDVISIRVLFSKHFFKKSCFESCFFIVI